MRKLKRVLLVIVSLIVVEFIVIGCIIGGVIVPGGKPSGQNDEIVQDDSSNNDANSGSSESGEATITVSSPLNITLSGTYLDAYNKATKNLSNSTSDKNKRLVAMIGLQILQSKVIKYENELHYYSLSYTSSGGSAAVVYYSLKDCINRINSGQRIYTDCFGFVRLAHSIAAYSINAEAPGSVSGLGGLYGKRGGYSAGVQITGMGNLSCSGVIYDRLTGTGSSTNRHVAMFLYSSGNSVVYMDQGGVYTGTLKENSYIYYQRTNPYKFNAFKSYC